MDPLALLLLFLTGAVIKINDDWQDEEKEKANAKQIFLSLLAGFFLFYVFLKANVDELLLAVVLGSIFMGKIDNIPHGIVATFVIFAFLFTARAINMGMLIFFFIGSALDETEFPIIKDYRPMLKLFALYPAIMGYADPLIAVLSFDIGYLLAGRIRTIGKV